MSRFFPPSAAHPIDPASASSALDGWLGVVELAGVVALGLWIAVAAGGALLVPAALRRLRSLPPARRSVWLLALALAPTLLPVAFALLCLLPSLLATAGLHADHCPVHAGHRHLCVTHRPSGLPAAWGALALAGFAPLLWASCHALRTARRTRRLRSSLALAATGTRDGITWIDSAQPLALTAGLLHPRAFVSQRLAHQLGADALEVVIAHERAHAQRRDGLRRWCGAALSVGHAPPIRRQLLDALSLACEQACDAAAARVVGDRLRVAETVLAAARRLGPVPPTLCAFGRSATEERVEALLAPEPPAAAPRRRRTGHAKLLLGSLAVAVAVALADPLHHLAEHVLSLLPG